MLEMVMALMIAAPQREYMTEIVSPVYEAEGDPAHLVARATTCMSQRLAPDGRGGSVIISSDPAAGVVVGNNALEYRDRLVPWRVRSRLTFEARDGRFRLTHSNIERHNDQTIGSQFTGASPWVQIGKWRGSGWQKAQEAFEAVSAGVAECVTAQAAPDDW